MAETKVLRAFVHVVGADGYAVALAAGSTIPAEYADQVTNPAAYDIVEVADAPETVTPTVTPAVTPTVTPDTTPTSETPPATADDETPPWEKQAVEPTTVEPTTVEPTTVEPTTVEPTTVEPTTVEPTSTPAPVVDYSELAFADLQKLAKSRELSGAGNTDALIARLEADDRDIAAAATN